MKNARMVFILLIVLVLAVILPGCTYGDNYSSEDQKVAEDYAVMYLMSRGARPLSVEETVYDAENDKYIIILVRTEVFVIEGREYFDPIEDDEDLTPRVVIIGVADGVISHIQRDDESEYHWAEWTVHTTSEKVTVEGPGGKMFEFDVPQR